MFILGYFQVTKLRDNLRLMVKYEDLLNYTKYCKKTLSFNVLTEKNLDLQYNVSMGLPYLL